MGEHSAPGGAREADAVKVGAFHPLDSVVPGQSLVHVGVVRGEQFQNAAVRLHDVSEKQLRFRAHGLAQLLVELREQLLVGRNCFEVPRLEPLAGEVVDYRAGFGMAQQPADLRLKIGAQLVLLREPKESLVRQAAPEKVGQAGGERELIHVHRRSGWRRGDVRGGAVAEEKVRRHEHSLHGAGDAHFKGVSAPPAFPGELHEAADLLSRNRPAISPAGEASEDVPRHLAVGADLRFGVKQPLMGFRHQPLHGHWSFNLQPFDGNGAALLRSLLPEDGFLLGQAILDAADDGTDAIPPGG